MEYLTTCIDQVHEFNDILQLVIVELVYKVCHANPSERARFIRCIYNLLNSSSAAVRYEAAGTLVTLSSSPTAIKVIIADDGRGIFLTLCYYHRDYIVILLICIYNMIIYSLLPSNNHYAVLCLLINAHLIQAAAQCYVELIVKESDNNVKLIVLDRLMSLRGVASHERVLQELVMDILRVLSSPDLEVRKKTLALVLDLVTSRNIEEVSQHYLDEIPCTVKRHFYVRDKFMRIR